MFIAVTQYISVIIFEVNIADEQKQTELVTIFCKFPLPSTVLVRPLPYRTVARKFSIGGFTSDQGVLTFWNLIKTPPIYSAS